MIQAGKQTNVIANWNAMSKRYSARFSQEKQKRVEVFITMLAGFGWLFVMASLILRGKPLELLVELGAAIGRELKGII